jgi:hypothetical protein
MLDIQYNQSAHIWLVFNTAEILFCTDACNYALRFYYDDNFSFLYVNNNFKGISFYIELSALNACNKVNNYKPKPT